VPTVEDVVNIGDEIQVLVTEIDRQGRVNLSRRALLEPSENGHHEDGAERNGDMNQGERRPRPFNERRGRDGDRGDRGGRGGGYGGRDRDRGPRRESSGDNRDREREGSSGTREPARDAEPAAEPARRPRRESSGDRPRGSATGRRASLRSPTPEE